MARSKFRWLGRCSSAIIMSLVLLALYAMPTFAIYYPNEYPDYIPFVGGKYIEVNTSIGVGTIIVSSSVPDRYLSLGRNNSYIYNSSSSTIQGVFRLANGTDYSIRFPSFDVAQYYTSGYNPTYTTLTITEILNTNIEFEDYSGRDKQNDAFIFSNNIELFQCVCAVCSAISSFLILIIVFWRLKND